MTKYEEFKKFVELADEYSESMKKVKALEEEFSGMANKLMPEIHTRFANGEMWEYKEHFHVGCEECRWISVETVRKALNLKTKK